jgi:hypothetical protein
MSVVGLLHGGHRIFHDAFGVECLLDGHGFLLCVALVKSAGFSVAEALPTP